MGRKWYFLFNQEFLRCFQYVNISILVFFSLVALVGCTALFHCILWLLIVYSWHCSFLLVLSFCFEFFFYSVFPFIIYPSPFTLPYSLFPVALVKNSRASHLRALVNKVSYWQTSNATTVPVLVSQFQIFLSEYLTSSIYSLPCLGENLSETVERHNFIHVAQWKRRQTPQFIPAPSDNWSTAYN